MALAWARLPLGLGVTAQEAADLFDPAPAFDGGLFAFQRLVVGEEVLELGQPVGLQMADAAHPVKPGMGQRHC